MKKLILTAVLAIATLFVSAQSFMVVTDLIKTADGEEAGMKNITDRIGVGYQVNDNFIVGVQSAAGEDGYDMFFRYLWKEYIYVSLNMPTEEATDNMKIGIGYSFNVWNSLYIEPNYNMPLSEDASGDRKGDFNLGLSYRF
ncbi:MAG TPA: hypothetical protein QGG91_02870 [Flavobacteriales bacterium]|jgi:hypothetical protein|nr:hypothetical protein [Flavobacteriales bacterium]HJN63637.1 hypothetical protein [Flavobacteriales bacterium]|tara:strand:+ start:906 stop:1328 length:423 start_codon:yes stop_codon:yes gene_type:complete